MQTMRETLVTILFDLSIYEVEESEWQRSSFILYKLQNGFHFSIYINVDHENRRKVSKRKLKFDFFPGFLNIITK